MSELYQIYWKDEQLDNLYPFAIPYKNEILTPFFENSVICEVVPKSKADKIGVCSHALRQKIGGGIPMRKEFTEEDIESDYEVLCLGRSDQTQRMIWRLDHWHPGAAAILYRIFEKLGKQKPGEPRDPIYQNHFLAQRQIYLDYLSELLIPSMYLMQHDEEISHLVSVDSNYFKLKPPYSEFAQRCEKFFGKKDYCPLHAFICERLFSIWMTTKPIKVKYI